MKKYVLALSLGKGILNSKSREYARMKEYARELAEYHIIVLGKNNESVVIQDENLYVYAPKAVTKIGAFCAAFLVAAKILKKSKGMFVITAQDPFETSVLGLILARIYKAKHHVQVHGDFFGSDFWFRERGLNPLRRMFGLFAIRHSSGVRVVSERSKRSLVSLGIPEKHITVLPIRAELDMFCRVVRTPRADAVRIVTASRLAPEKNIESIIESAVTLLAEGKQVSLEIVGSGSKEGALKALVLERGISAHVTFTPWVHNMASVYARADIFALASNHEGYALVLVEALASGTPVVTTDVGCAGEVVFDGVHGFVVPPGNRTAYVEALRTLVDDEALRERMGVAGRELGQRLSAVSHDAYVQAWVATLP